MLAIPAFESFGLRRRFVSADDNSGPRPKRVVFLGFGYGVTNETWFPDVKHTGTGYPLPEGLKPLERHKSDFTIIQGMSNQYNNEAHWGSTFWLTGANRYSQPGQSFHNSVSADQVAAAHLGTETRFASIQLGSEDVKTSGHGPGLSLAWDVHGKPISGLDNPVSTFHRMFSADSLPLEERQARLAQQRSVLDAVLSDARRVQRNLNRTDADKLNEFFQSIRDIEIRLGKEEQWLSIPKPTAPLQDPQEGIAGRDEIRMMYQMIVAAFRTDSTRVISYRQPVGTLLKSLSIQFAPHDVSHYLPGDRTVASQTRDLAQAELLAGLIDQLKATLEPDGSSLFDHTILVYGSNIRSIHYLDNCPTLIAGRGAGLKLGEHIVLKEKNTPLCNLWLTLLNGIGAPVKSHGDSTGVLSDVQIG
jgi:hypothetical protein